MEGIVAAAQKHENKQTHFFFRIFLARRTFTPTQKINFRKMSFASNGCVDAELKTRNQSVLMLSEWRRGKEQRGNF